MEQRLVGDIPLDGASYEDYLRRPGLIRGNLAMRAADDNVELLDEGRFALYAMRDETIEQGGIMQRLFVPLGEERVEVTALGWLAYFDRRRLRVDRTFSQEDQLVIFKTLVDDCQDETVIDTWTPTPGGLVNGVGADLGLTVSWAALSGVLRDRLTDYRWFLGKNLGQMLRELAAVENGFDYRMTYTIGGPDLDQIVKTVTLSYPRQGVDYRDQAGFEFARSGTGFEYQRNEKSNVLRREVDRDSSKMAWRKRGWGTGQDVSRVYADAVDEAKRGVYPIYEDDLLTSITEPTTMQERTDGSLIETKDTKRLPSFEVDVNLDPKWGTYWTGDIFDVTIIDGFASLTGAHRIVGFKMDAVSDVPRLYVQEVE